MNKIKEVTTFLFFNDNQISVDFLRQDGKPAREYQPSAFAAGFLANVIWGKNWAEEMEVRPFIQSEVDAWGWIARVK